MTQIKQVVLSWDDVPDMAFSIKQAVELSIWNLFEVASELEKAKYLLDTTDIRYFLESSGTIIKAVDPTDFFEIRERIFFEGLRVTSENH